MGELDLQTAHRLSFRNRELLATADQCACFYCCSIYSPSEITEWVDEPSFDAEGVTALCERCGIDAVIPIRPGVDKQFLAEMKRFWFK